MFCLGGLFMKKQLMALTALGVLSLSTTAAHAETDLSKVNKKADSTMTQEMKAAADKKTADYAMRFSGTKGIAPESDPDIPASMRLSTTSYIAQPTVDTCGPTSAHNLLLNWGKNVSLSTLQTDLGYVQGDGTGFASAWPTTLNKHSASSYYVLLWTPSQSTLWNAFVGDSLDNQPFILDVHMSSATGSLVGYASGTEYWHYVTGNGYSGYSQTTQYGDYYDPYNGRSGTYGQHSMTVGSLVPLVKDRGIVY
jgi:hypothetical protein